MAKKRKAKKTSGRKKRSKGMMDSVMDAVGLGKKKKRRKSPHPT